MKLGPWAFFAGAAFIVSGSPHESGWTLFVSGDFAGNLTPCGCTTPMAGGVLRRATAIRALAGPNQAVLLENGGFVKSAGRQDVLKVQVIAELNRLVPEGVLRCGEDELALGSAAIQSMNDLSKGRVIAPEGTGTSARRVAGSALVGVVDTPAAAKDLADDASARGLALRPSTPRWPKRDGRWPARYQVGPRPFTVEFSAAWPTAWSRSERPRTWRALPWG